MARRNLAFIFLSFLVWKLFHFAVIFFAEKYLPLQANFLGGGMANYLSNPYFWSWVNFDGEHYLSLAREGYRDLTYFYFPLYPLTVSAIARFVGNGILEVALIGLIVSNLAFIIALIGIWKIVELEFSKKLAKLTILLLLFFPTSFYFGAFYTESLFLALCVWSFYFFRTKRNGLSGIAGSLLSATRLMGVTLIVAFAAEVLWLARKTKSVSFKYAPLILIPLGLIFYLIFLYKETGDPLEFLHSVDIFGEQRSSQIILLPQVFYRYFFKVLPALKFSYFPGTFATLLEIVSAMVFLVLSILAFLKLKVSYAVYSLLAYLIPTFSGSFSSLPRYVLILFPLFILAAIYIAKAPKILQISIFALLLVVQALAFALFSRAYWVA